MIGKLGQQMGERAGAGRMAPVTPEQFFVTLASACAFPFAAKPMLAAVLGLGPKRFEVFIEQRRKELPAFLKRGLRP